jgi:hypothetical protein
LPLDRALGRKLPQSISPGMIYNTNNDLQNRDPKQVLQSLERAYQDKNIDLYKKLLAPDFRLSCSLLKSIR